MSEHIWTDAEEERQDCVDNAVHNLIEELARGHEIEWDIEDIAEVREAVHAIIVDKLNLMTSYDFYPYEELESEPDGNIILVPVPPSTEQQEIIVTDEQLVTAITKVIQEDLDAEDLCVVAKDILGGLCWYNEDNTYTFIPTECYWGAFDGIEN